MRPSRFTGLTSLLLAAVALAFLAPGPSRLHADEAPKKEPGKDGDKPGDPPKPDGEEDTDDFFEGDTTFTPKQVDDAIKKGVNWLRKRQSAEGTWGLTEGNATYGGGQGGAGYGHPAGATSLALYTLLKCGVPVADPSVKKGFKYLKDSNNDKPGSSYETSMLMLAVCATADANKSLKASEKKAEKLKLSGEMRGWAQVLQKHLLDKRKLKGWRYQVPGTQGAAGGEQDLSSTQLAALALFAAHRLGIRTDERVWEDILSYALEQQDDSGPDVIEEDPVTKQKQTWHARGFSYIKGESHPEEGQPVGSMTACGVGTAMIARFVLSDGGKKKAAWDARPDAAKVQNAVQDGLAWLITNWSPFDNPKKSQMNVYHLYYLYSFERMMDLIARHKVGAHLWYSEMGQAILNRQADDGHWETGTTHKPGDVLDTCFALLFLKRATKGAIPFPSLTGGSEDAPVDGR